MSSLDKIVEIERSVNIYQNSDNELVEEIIIDIPLEKLKEIVTAKEEDPSLYEAYLLNDQQLEKINLLLEKKIEPDFTQFFYVLEAAGIYDWSAN
ncbi:MAG: hypothetical protein EPN92_06905 [Chitinophagaceae bacterium]|nr:MAG: hypothetical protein EPN92_06905 [Chitinophagaceae bacterium]